MRRLIGVLLELFFPPPDDSPYLRVEGVSGGQVGLLQAGVPATDQRVGEAQVGLTADVLCCRGWIWKISFKLFFMGFIHPLQPHI